MRQSWTDDRLDDFRAETARRFADVDKRFDKVEGEIKDLRGEMNARFDSLHARFDSLQRLMLWFSGALIVALTGFMITQIWFMATQA